MGTLARVVRWVLLVAPCRFYLAGEASGGAAPWSFLAAFCGAALGGGGLGALIAVGLNEPITDGLWSGLFVGMVAVLAWSVYALLALLALWVLGRAPAEVVLSGTPARGRHAGPVDRGGWRRRREDPLVPASAVAFLALMTAFMSVDWLWIEHSEQRYADVDSVAQAQVLFWDDGRLGLQERELVVRFATPQRVITTRLLAEDLYGAIPEPEQLLTVEYPSRDPERARPAGTAEAHAGDALFSLTASITMAALTVLAAAVHTVGRRQRR